MRVIHLIQHLPHIPGGQLQTQLAANPNAQLNLICAWELTSEQITAQFQNIAPTDTLIVLGGSMDAYSDAHYPWIGPLKTLLKQRVSAPGKTLGICLGHQLAAVATGGTVTVGKLTPPERETIALNWQENPIITQIFGEIPALAYADHGDVVTKCPPNATVVASNHNGIQVLLYTSTYLTVQFHPEVDENVLTSWYQETEPSQLAPAQRAYNAAKLQLDATATALANWLVQD